MPTGVDQVPAAALHPHVRGLPDTGGVKEILNINIS